MTYRTPFLDVTDPVQNIDWKQRWGSRLVGVRIVTRFANEQDECTFTFTNEPPYLDDPGENAPFTVHIGWSRGAMVLGGLYYYARAEYSGTPAEGDRVSYVCRSGLTADLEAVDSRHFNAENGNKTLGDVFKNLFSDVPVEVVVSPSIASMPLPGGYLLQYKQSNIDFATDLADKVGAIVKPMGGKILVLDYASGQTVTGQNLVVVNVNKFPGYRYSAEMEPRFLYRKVVSGWFDDASGRNKTESSTDAGGIGASDGLPHPAPDQASAVTFATARACEYKRYSGTALFEMPGEPNAVAGCRVIATNFPPAINAVNWIAAEVTHEVMPEQGWITTIETETDTA